MKNLVLALAASVTILSGSVVAEGADWRNRMAHQRGVEAIIWAMPAVSMMALRDANFSLGGGYNTIYYLTKPPTASLAAIPAPPPRASGKFLWPVQGRTIAGLQRK